MMMRLSVQVAAGLPEMEDDDDVAGVGCGNEEKDKREYLFVV